MGKVLDCVNSPEDLKNLGIDDLKNLAAEIRECLVETVSRTGGHLASNLGVVELSIALHRTLNSPRDKIIWDVGHQSYVHKILTGRKNELPILRKRGDLSGSRKHRKASTIALTPGTAAHQYPPPWGWPRQGI